MLRIPVSKLHQRKPWVRANSSSSSIRETFINYFVGKHKHKFVKSSSVVPLSDPTVPFVNAGMNQFKGVFLGTVEPPHPRVVNSQKCVRVGGKHNDLEIVGTDGHHHTFFEMLGNWSFGDYYKEEACKMSWDLLTGPFKLDPQKLLVTYFEGDPVIGLIEDRECRDAWKKIGVPPERLLARNASDNFWEMGNTGPCGPCTEIHYINADGSLTELWNLVFIHCNRESDGKVVGLRSRHVDTGMGLERMAALLQGVPSNYDTDLFKPIIRAIEENCKSVNRYKGRYGKDAELDTEYRRLADHARMVSVCLADGAFPSSSLNLKQIMRRSFKICSDVFQNPDLMPKLYKAVMETLGLTYPELISKESQAKNIMEHEAEAYRKLRSGLKKKWNNLVKEHPEVESLSDVELSGFPLGYTEFKKEMAKSKSNHIPGDVAFKLYDTHGFHEKLIDRIAKLNKMTIDREGFWKRLQQHKARHKVSLREFISPRGDKYNEAINNLNEEGITFTNDSPKYEFKEENGKIVFTPIKTKLVGILNEDLEWIDYLDPCEELPYCLITQDTNFYCEEGGQISDSGAIVIDEKIVFNVETVFKIRDFVFHKGYFKLEEKNKDNSYVNNKWCSAVLAIDSVKRLEIMKNHTATHLLNAAVKQVLPKSGICQVGSRVSDNGLHLALSVYGAKLTDENVNKIQDLVRKAIDSNVKVLTQVVNRHQFDDDSVTTVPGERYPESNIRLVSTNGPVPTKELCCGTHVPSTGYLQEFCITHVKGAKSNSPTIYAIAGEAAKEAREQFCRAEKLGEVCELLEPDRKAEEVSAMRAALERLCPGSGAPAAGLAKCLAVLDTVMNRPSSASENELQAVAEQELLAAIENALEEKREFVVHFLRCSYLLGAGGLRAALRAAPHAQLPALLIGCAGGTILAACRVPQSMVTDSFTAERWLSCILPVFGARIDREPAHFAQHFAQMTATKVSLITCEQQVQDAMRIAIKYAQSQLKERQSDAGSPKAGSSDQSSAEGIDLKTDDRTSKGMRQN